MRFLVPHNLLQGSSSSWISALSVRTQAGLRSHPPGSRSHPPWGSQEGSQEAQREQETHLDQEGNANRMDRADETPPSTESVTSEGSTKTRPARRVSVLFCADVYST